MRICFVCGEYPPGPHGGIGTSTRDLARALVGAGHKVRVVGMYPGAYPAPDYEEDQGVRVWRLRRWGSRWSWIADRYRLYRWVARWAKRDEIDLVDVPDYQGWAAAWPRLSVPVISRWCGSASCISTATGRPIDRRTLRLERASLRRSDFQCAKSLHLVRQTQEVFGLGGAAPTILCNPIDIPAVLPPVPRTTNRIVFTGTLNANKGILPLVKAWPRVLDMYPEAELHVFGKDGRSPDGQSMTAFLPSLLSDRQRPSVHFYGHVGRSILFASLVTARAAVFPSYFEGFGSAPLEAMACACPTIISSRVSPEIFEGFDGPRIDPDYPEQIAAAILRLLDDDRFAQHCAEAGRKHVQERFSMPVITAKNEEFYRQCIDSFHSRRSVRVRTIARDTLSPRLATHKTE